MISAMMFSIRKFFRRDRSNSQIPNRKFGDKKFTNNKFRAMQRSRGFTLVELLVAMLITTFIVSSLLSFVTSILDTDRTEQAKSESQGEIQTALGYISNDLQEAIYIYNSDGLNASSTDTPRGIKDQLPAFSNSVPVLVFWKRVYYATTDELRVDTANANTKKMVGCLEYGTSTTNTAPPPTPPAAAAANADCPIVSGTPRGSGKYAYSLVAYYLVYDGDSTWSKAARIARWELKDGIRHGTCSLKITANCSEPRPIQQVNLNADGSSFINYWTVADQGFRPFDTSGSDIDTVMKQWTTTSGSNTAYNLTANPRTVLLDFIDDTPYVATQDDGTVGNSPVDIAVRNNNNDSPNVNGKTINADCSNPDIGVGVIGDFTDPKFQIAQRVPRTFQTTSTNKAETLSSFYICVNSDQTAARVYLRGNVLARLRPNQPIAQRPVSNQNTYLSNGSIRAYGRGKLSLQ